MTALNNRRWLIVLPDVTNSFRDHMCHVKDLEYSSGVNDSAAAVLLMSKVEVEKRNLKPLAQIVAWAQTGLKPEIMGLGPVSAVKSVLAKTNWSKDEVDLYELNEAQSLAVLKNLELDAKVNINGGAIAIGQYFSADSFRDHMCHVKDLEYSHIFSI